MINKPYGLEITFKTKTRVEWFSSATERREKELKLIKNPKVLIITTIGKRD